MVAIQNRGCRVFIVTPWIFSMSGWWHIMRGYLSRWQRMMCAVLGVVILAGCDHEPLVHNLTEREANRLVTHLHAEGLEVTKVARPDGRYALEASPERALAALRYIEDNRLVRDSSAANTEPAGLGSSKEDRRFRAERALSRSIEATLDSIPGVLESRVHLNVPTDDALFGGGSAARSKSTASVLIVAAHDANVPLEDIATLVGGAAGIPPSDVAVVFRVVSPRRIDSATEAFAPAVTATAGGQIKEFLTPYLRGAGWEIGISLVILGFGLVRFGLRPRRKTVRRLTASEAVGSSAIGDGAGVGTAGRVA